MRYIPRIVRFTVYFAFPLWADYTDHLRVEGTRRAGAHARMAHAVNIPKTNPQTKREDYSWVPAAVPSAKAVLRSYGGREM